MSAHPKPDFEHAFNLMPGLCLVLDPTFIIVAQNDEHARVTQSAGRKIVGQNVFAAFPDNPDDSGATGVSRIRDSLLKVLKSGTSSKKALEKSEREEHLRTRNPMRPEAGVAAGSDEDPKS